jgi:hypothetical protein
VHRVLNPASYIQRAAIEVWHKKFLLWQLY